MAQAALKEYGFVDPTTKENRSKLAKMIMRLFEHWDIPVADQLELLGQSPKSRNLLGKYRKGEPLPAGRDSMDRVGYLLSIHSSLQTLFPENPNLVYKWPHVRNQAFAGRTPLEVMKEEGHLGLIKVAWHLQTRLSR
ncbi:MAG: antitoxin Xre/MbcA/ParS toxin-binding domain-containing protein [Thermodesulfobacteriota bacterium]|jgi:hypothetical protein|nr:antitoxin Xre/MbcA/ParS toxin-binding domain-containing protein [Thermodesulfobacteriota bacterium]